MINDYSGPWRLFETTREIGQATATTLVSKAYKLAEQTRLVIVKERF